MQTTPQNQDIISAISEEIKEKNRSKLFKHHK